MSRPAGIERALTERVRAWVEARRELGERGLGDTVARILEAGGISEPLQTALRLLFGSCGCEARREWLNREYPYR